MADITDRRASRKCAAAMSGRPGCRLRHSTRPRRLGCGASAKALQKLSFFDSARSAIRMPRQGGWHFFSINSVMGKSLRRECGVVASPARHALCEWATIPGSDDERLEKVPSAHLTLKEYPHMSATVSPVNPAVKPGS